MTIEITMEYFKNMSDIFRDEYNCTMSIKFGTDDMEIKIKTNYRSNFYWTRRYKIGPNLETELKDIYKEFERSVIKSKLNIG